MRKSKVDLDFRPEYWPTDLPKSQRKPVTIVEIIIHSGMGDGISVTARWSRGRVRFEADDGCSDHQVWFGGPTNAPLAFRELVEALDGMTSTADDDPEGFPYDVSPAYWLRGGGRGIEICSDYYPGLDEYFRRRETGEFDS